MNRLILIGNGFDCAHNLKTKYENFIYWYWKRVVAHMLTKSIDTYEDELCKVTNHELDYWGKYYLFHSEEEKDIYKFFINKEGDIDIEFSPLFERINKSVQTKGWVDIENEYYDLLKEYAFVDNINKVKELNAHLQYLKERLIEYLTYIDKQEVSINENIKNKMYAPIKLDEMSIASRHLLKEYVNSWIEQNDSIVKSKIHRYGLNEEIFDNEIASFRKNYKAGRVPFTDIPRHYMYPDAVMLLSFNYTHFAQLYHNEDLGFINYIHGKIEKPSGVIFGYGDELDENYKALQNKNDNNCLSNIKSIKYLEEESYRRLLAFIDAQPYQVVIMGHSCGNSDRTLLNTIFEHPNCISIKPYYYIKKNGKDNYSDLTMNICRNFTDMKLMRDKMVNKTYCEPLTRQ
ncbi:Bacteriophage abortive infection AbiH [Prevotellaceae bacterium MN60]|nr:Bacteriophage abortive infection AbiH [Prevotellaceae bacterium MN60]